MAAIDYVSRYHEEIEAGHAIVSNKVRTIYARLAAEIEADEGRWTYDAARGDRCIRWIEAFCRHSKGEWAGKPVRLALWQRAFVSALFGFIDRETGESRFNEAVLLLGRKGGKSTLAACLCLYCFVALGQADILCAATKLDQAKKVFDEAVHMVEQSATLKRRIRKRRADLYIEATKSTFRPLGRNSHTMDGENASMCVADELHALEGENGRNLVEVLRQSQSARKNTIFLVVSTCGTVRNGIFDDYYALCSGILDGTITGGAADRLLPVIYELDESTEWREPLAWYKANPSLEVGDSGLIDGGEVKKLDYLVSACERAEANPVDLNGILTKDFNVRTSSAGSWLPFHVFRNDETFDLKDCAGKWCLGGVDLSKVGDLTAGSIVMPGDDGKWLVFQCCWLPADKLKEHVERDKIPYDNWVRQGLVRTCEGGVVRTEDVTAWFLEIVREHDISVASVYYDAWSATAWVDEMRRHGFRMVPVHQGAKTLSLPLDHLESALRNHQVIYNEASQGRNSCLEWALSNTGTSADRNGNRVITKNLSPRHRIDPAAALLDCWVGLLANPDFADL